MYSREPGSVRKQISCLCGSVVIAGKPYRTRQCWPDPSGGSAKEMQRIRSASGYVHDSGDPRSSTGEGSGCSEIAGALIVLCVDESQHHGPFFVAPPTSSDAEAAERIAVG